jgi:hypothetical protein
VIHPSHASAAYQVQQQKGAELGGHGFHVAAIGAFDTNEGVEIGDVYFATALAASDDRNSIREDVHRFFFRIHQISLIPCTAPGTLPAVGFGVHMKL